MNSLLSTTRNTRYITSKLIRSDVPISITEADKKFLLANNFRTVIDLRLLKAAEHHKNALNCKEFNYFNIPISSGDIAPKRGQEWIQVYNEILYSDSASKVLDILKHTDGNVIINCTAGKDRTGVLSAVIEYLLGWNIDTIIEDYMKSEEMLGNWFEEWERITGYSKFNNLPQKEYIESVLSDYKLLELYYSPLREIIYRKYSDET